VNDPSSGSSSEKASGQRGVHGARTRGREIALKALYATDLKRANEPEDFDAFVVHQGERGASVPYARELYAGAMAARDQIDRLLRGLAANWTLERMAAVDRNVLRLGCYELLIGQGAPPAVVINEAVDLAKKFGAKDSGAFVNGILDRVRIRMDAGEDLLAEGPATPPKEA